MQVNSAEPSTSIPRRAFRAHSGRRPALPVDSPARRRLRLRLPIGRAVLFRRSGRPRRLGRRDRADAGARSPTRARSRRSSRGQQERRGAPARAREAGAPARRPPHGRDRHRPAGRAVRRPAVHAAQGADRAQARRAGRRATTSVPAVAVFWIDAEDHDWDEVRSCTVFDDDADAAQRLAAGAARRRTGARRAPSRSIDSILDALDELERLLPPTEFRAGAPRRACGAPTRRASAWPTRSAAGWKQVLGERGLVVYDSSDPASKPLVSQVFARELSMPGQTVEAGGARRLGSHRARLPRAGARAGRQPRAVPPRRRPRARSASRTAASSSAISSSPRRRSSSRRPTQPAGFSPNVLLRPDRAGHAVSRRSATSPVRTSSPTSASCAASTSTSACRCR